MNTLLKHAVLLTTIALMIGLGACKKNNSNNNLNSFLGNYSCVQHYQVTFGGPGAGTDSVVGTANIVVTQTGDSTISVYGDTFSLYTSNTFYAFEDNTIAYTYFYNQGDSIYYQQIIRHNAGETWSYYFAGHKIP